MTRKIFAKVMTGLAAFHLSFFSLHLFAVALPSEITVKLNMDHDSYVAGERLRAVVDVANASADDIDCRNKPNSPDQLFIELFRSSDGHQYDKLSEKPFVAAFALLSGEGQKLEVILADHFGFHEKTRYRARAVLVHDDMRFESAFRHFDLVPGMPCGGALQMFSNQAGLKREFELVHWGRNQVEHIFLKAKDAGTSSREWHTIDLGPVLRVTRPKISVMPSGEVFVLHRASQDMFIRSVFWSLPGAFEFQEREKMVDPDVAGAARVKELYKEAGSMEPVKKAWWKFW